MCRPCLINYTSQVNPNNRTAPTDLNAKQLLQGIRIVSLLLSPCLEPGIAFSRLFHFLKQLQRLRERWTSLNAKCGAINISGDQGRSRPHPWLVGKTGARHPHKTRICLRVGDTQVTRFQNMHKHVTESGGTHPVDPVSMSAGEDLSNQPWNDTLAAPEVEYQPVSA